MGEFPGVIVLDTHVWYWWINLDFDRLSSEIIEAIEDVPHVGVSVVSCFELALSGSDIELLALTPEIASRAVNLTEVHRDPFNRVIIATALMVDGLLASVDGHFPAYPELSGRLLGAV